MNKEMLWNLFSQTGKIEYYLKYKEMSREKDGKNNKRRQNL
ncbi:MAG: YqzL family protein [Bacilli bacterium]